MQTIAIDNYASATAFEPFEGTFLQNAKQMGHSIFLSASPPPPSCFPREGLWGFGENWNDQISFYFTVNFTYHTQKVKNIKYAGDCH